MDDSLIHFISLGQKYMPFARDEIRARAEEFQSLVDQGNRAVAHWGGYKLFAQFAVRYFHERNSHLQINRPLAQKEIIRHLQEEEERGIIISTYSDVIRMINRHVN